MAKEQYIAPEMEIIEFDNDDVIQESSETQRIKGLPNKLYTPDGFVQSPE